jgi:hypothetical protein
MAKFLSKSKNQVLCMVPDTQQVINGITMPVKGERIHFNNGEFEADEKTEDGKRKADYIRGHRLFGSRIIEDKPKTTK